MSEKSKRVSNKGKEQFRFMPMSTSDTRQQYPSFNAATTTILVTSAAASDKKRTRHRADSHMPDLYVLVEIVEADCKGDTWTAQIVDIIGESTDLASCATVLMYNRGLTDLNGPLQPRPKVSVSNCVADKASTTVFKVNTSAPAVQPDAVPFEDGRVDLRTPAGEKNSQYTIFSVDPPGCLDIDDAVHIRPLTTAEVASHAADIIASMRWESLPASELRASLDAATVYEIGVHIADVTNYIKHLAVPYSSGDVKPGPSNKPRRTLAEEALHRSFTVYLPHQQIPILPTFLSHDECSLKPGEDKLAMSCIVTVVSTSTANPRNPKCTFKVASSRFQRSLIRTAGAYTYDQVDEFLSKQQAGKEEADANETGNSAPTTDAKRSAVHSVREQDFEVKLKSQLASGPSATASAAGGNLSGKAPTSAVKFGLKLLHKLYPCLDSHEIIEQLMLLANTCAAEYLEAQCLRAAERASTSSAEQHLQCAYLLRRQLPARSAPEPPPEIAVEELALQDRSLEEAPRSGGRAEQWQQRAFRGVPVDFTANPAEYLYCPVAPSAAEVPGGKSTAEGLTQAGEATVAVPTAVEKAHVSLGARLYTHFTSPIRRYADQIVHALINHYLSLSADAPSDKTGAATDPWLQTFSPAAVAHINLKQKQHKKFSRDMTIVDFVFDQCTIAGRNEVTLDAEAVVLPFRFSDKYRAYKTDLYVFAPCEFVYPVKLHTAAQAQLFDISYTDNAVLLQSRQTKEIKRLRVGDRIAVQVHCSRSAPSIRKKCVISSPSITFA
jgi:hypothetical protein